MPRPNAHVDVTFESLRRCETSLTRQLGKLRNGCSGLGIEIPLRPPPVCRKKSVDELPKDRNR